MKSPPPRPEDKILIVPRTWPDAAPGTAKSRGTNVYADLGYRDAAAMKRKSRLVIEMGQRVEDRGLSPTDAP